VPGVIHRLELLRHAKSSWEDSQIDDHERPLARRGRRACARLRAHARERRLAPDLVLCSSAVRVVQTWEAIREGVAGSPKVCLEDALYGADAQALLRRLNEVPESVGVVLLIGHNPALEELAIGLVGDGDDRALRAMRAKYPTGGLASMAFGGKWRTLEPGGARLDAFVIPRQLE
jgi:phosphohistidine phosphatase